jgi:HAD superfamily hydrolase (TIGR01450 family)
MMKAIILAAGVGSRLRPVTRRRPKPCITIGSRPILAHQLRAYAKAGIGELVVVAGYRAGEIRELCETVAAEYDAFSVSVIENGRYDSTDNMYSFSLAREAVDGDDFLLSNGDVVFEPDAIKRLVESESGTEGRERSGNKDGGDGGGVGSAIACDTGTYDAESMKITLDGEGRIDHISKGIEGAAAYATSIDCYRFSAEFGTALFDEIDRRIDLDADAGWTEAAIDALLADFDVRPVDIAGLRWVEVDNHDDLVAADRLFSSLSALGEKEAVFFDLDGTLYLGDELTPGAEAVVSGLRERGVEVYFLSNNSSAWKTDYAAKLDALGIDADPENVILSTDGVLAHLESVGAAGVYVLGTEAMRRAVREGGFDVDSADPEHVVVGFDTELTYEKAAEATLAIRDGADFLLAHPDLVCPTPEGLVPDCGAIGAMIEAATGERPTRTFGKPGTDMIEHVLTERGYDPADVAIVGDRLATEIRMAERLGCESVCVLSGDATRADVEESPLQPTLVAEAVGDLLDRL